MVLISKNDTDLRTGSKHGIQSPQLILHTLPSTAQTSLGLLNAARQQRDVKCCSALCLLVLVWQVWAVYERPLFLILMHYSVASIPVVLALWLEFGSSYVLCFAGFPKHRARFSARKYDASDCATD